LWAIQLRVGTTAGRAHNDIIEVRVVTGSKSIFEAKHSSSIRHSKTVMQKCFAKAATEVCKSRLIAIVCLHPDVDLLRLSHAFAVIEAGIRTRRRIVVYDRRIHDRLFSAEQGFKGNGRCYGRYGCGALLQNFFC
jgi:hypothetical protein